jgi:predicted nuclease of predicted toxin-antitoxin system
MRILLDECLPRGLKAAIIDHSVSTVPEIGWGDLPDRAILEKALARERVIVLPT